MTWTVHRWIWQLDGPLYIGAPPAGSLNRARLYVPAQALWGAVTAELARNECNDSKPPEYKIVGNEVRKGMRFTYLYPAELCGSRWQTWLPNYCIDKGLVWQTEPSGTYTEEQRDERQFRRSLLSTRPGTAINPDNDVAEHGSLRETECIQMRWRHNHETDSSPVVMVGCVFTNCEELKRRLKTVDVLSLGGDSRYGLGRMRRIAFEPARTVFGYPVILEHENPLIQTRRVLAHATSSNMQGAFESLGGWDHRAQKSNVAMWAPGSRANCSVNPKWSIEENGTWLARN